MVANDHEAFIELQQYADFQNILSQRVCDDLDSAESLNQQIDPRLLKHDLAEGPVFSNYYARSALSPAGSRQGLSIPVSITTKRRSQELNGWERTYAPSLLEYGITQNTFLNFIDKFNETIEVSFSLMLTYSTPHLNRNSLHSKLLFLQSTTLELAKRNQIYQSSRPSLYFQ